MEQASKPTASRRGWWIAGGGALLVILISIALWFIVGPRVWTDGWRLHIPASQTSIREVIWTPPVPLEGFASDEQVYEPSISPDGTELYFVRGKAGTNSRIFVSHRLNNAWTKPAPVDAVNGPFDALGPRVSPDGNQLYFYSNRPGGLGGYDIWFSPRGKSGWGKPVNLGPTVNSEFNEFSPDPAPDGRHLIFATNRKAAKREQNEAWRSTIRETVSSDYDLWIANASTAKTQPGVPAFQNAREIPNVNTQFTEGASCMSPAGDFLYFASNRPGGAGKFDIYRSRVRDDEFDAPENLGKPINSEFNEADPALAYNGFRMIFSSDRPGAAGRYQLLIADSREVYPERHMRPFPHLGWSWWVLLLSLLVLIPLLLMMRGFDERKLGLLQRCLLMSLLVHALVTFILSFVVVTQKVTQYVRQQVEMEVPVNTAESQAFDETLAIRSQSTAGALPTSAPPVAAIAPARQPARESISAPAMASDVGAPRLNASSMSIPLQQTPLPPVAQASTPRVDVKPVAESSVAASTSIQASPLVSVKLGQVSAADATPQATSVQAAASRIKAASAAAIGKPTNIGVVSAPIGTGNQTGLSSATAVAHSASLPRGNGPQAAVGPSAVTAVAINGTLPKLNQARANEPSLGTSASALATTRPAGTSAVATGDIGQPGSISTGVASFNPADSNLGKIQMAGGSTGGAVLAIPTAAVSAGSQIGGEAVVSAAPKVGGPAAVGAPEASQTLANAAPALSSRLVVTGSGTTPGGSGISLNVAGPQVAAPPAESAIGAAVAPRVGLIGSNARTAMAPTPRADFVSGGAGSRSLGQPRVASSTITGANEKGVAAAATPAAAGGRLGGSGGDPASMATASVSLNSAPVSGESSAGAGGGLDASPIPGVGRAQLASADIKPRVALSMLTGPLGPTKSIAPDLAFIRSPERRQPMLDEFGGTKESEDAVSRGLAYLASVQESDGRWTRVDDNERRRRGRQRGQHDMACTGFSVLAFLGHGDSPTVAGPYQKVLADGIAYLIDRQDDNGDLRGFEQFRGGGSDSANMYDQGIATYALAEAAAITHDPRTIEAAKKGAQFIVDAQNDEGGWRYSPKEQGDSSVFGWQIMALHSAEAIGFEIPTPTLDGARNYIRSCNEGQYRLLAGYQPHNGPTPAMTAELLFSRMLLDLPMTDDGIAEATRYLAHEPPDANRADLYYWYYASLSMLHMQNPLWKDWNVLTRESLIRLQQEDGSWDVNLKWGERGGRVFTTSLATLTLEVYYRYLPLRLNKPASQP